MESISWHRAHVRHPKATAMERVAATMMPYPAIRRGWFAAKSTLTAAAAAAAARGAARARGATPMRTTDPPHPAAVRARALSDKPASRT
eukprot:gene20752-biopygen13131